MDMLFSLPKKDKIVFPKLSVNARTVAFRYRMKNLARVHDSQILKNSLPYFPALQSLARIPQNKVNAT